MGAPFLEAFFIGSGSGQNELNVFFVMAVMKGFKEDFMVLLFAVAGGEDKDFLVLETGGLFAKRWMEILLNDVGDDVTVGFEVVFRLEKIADEFAGIVDGVHLGEKPLIKQMVPRIVGPADVHEAD